METIALVTSLMSIGLIVFLILIVRQRFEFERKQRETFIQEIKELVSQTEGGGDEKYLETVRSIKEIVEKQKLDVEQSVKEAGKRTKLSGQYKSHTGEYAKLVEELQPILEEFDTVLTNISTQVINETRQEISSIRQSQKELHKTLVEMSAVDKFVNLLTDEEEKQAAIISAIRRLGNDELAIRLAVSYPSRGATSILQDIAISGKGNEMVAWALQGIADDHMKNNRLSEAEIYYKQTLVALESVYGDEHQDIAEVLDCLAQIAMKEGRAIEAEEFLERSTNIKNNLHGSETAEVAENCIKLADFYSGQQRFHEAKPLYNRALEITRRSYGEDSEQAMGLLSKLAELTKWLEQPQETAAIYEQIAEHQTGKELHKTLLQLIPVYEATSNWEGLESLYRRLIKLCEHRETKDELNKSEYMRSLARVLLRQGNKIEATDIYKEVLEDLEGYLGPEHDDVLAVVDELSDVLIEQGYLTVASPYVMRTFKKSLADTETDKFRRLLGKIKLLAERLIEEKEFDVAEEMYQQCLASMEKLKNPPKRAIVGLLRKIGYLCAQLEDYEKSEAAMRRAIRITEIIFDEDHPETMTLLMQLGHLLRKCGKYDEAEECYKRVLEMRYKILGDNHPDIIESLAELSKLCKVQNKEEEAEIYEEGALEIAREIYGEKAVELSEITEAIKNFDPNAGVISGGYAKVDQKSGT